MVQIAGASQGGELNNCDPKIWDGRHVQLETGYTDKIEAEAIPVAYIFGYLLLTDTLISALCLQYPNSIIWR